MSVSVLQQAKIQAQVLVPLVKALQAELGEERANAIVRKALRDLYRGYGEEFWRAKNEDNLGKAMTSAFTTFASDDALDTEVKQQSQDAFDLAVTRCRYAEFYQALGEPELGFLLVCSADYFVSWPRDLARRSSSPARKPSCRARAIATFVTGDHGRLSERKLPSHPLFRPASQLSPGDGFDHGHTVGAVVKARDGGEMLAAGLAKVAGVLDADLFQRLQAVRREAGR